MKKPSWLEGFQQHQFAEDFCLSVCDSDGEMELAGLGIPPLPRDCTWIGNLIQVVPP
jgi:hypothetical protein